MKVGRFSSARLFKVFLVLLTIVQTKKLFLWVKKIPLAEKTFPATIQIKMYFKTAAADAESNGKTLEFTDFKEVEKARFYQEEYTLIVDTDIIKSYTNFHVDLSINSVNSQNYITNDLHTGDCDRTLSLANGAIEVGVTSCCYDQSTGACIESAFSPTECPVMSGLNPEIYTPKKVVFLKLSTVENKIIPDGLFLYEDCGLSGYVEPVKRIHPYIQSFLIPVHSDDNDFDIKTADYNTQITLALDTKINQPVSTASHGVVADLTLFTNKDRSSLTNQEVTISVVYTNRIATGSNVKSYQFCCKSEQNREICDGGYQHSSLLDITSNSHMIFSCYVSKQTNFLVLEIYVGDLDIDNLKKSTYKLHNEFFIQFSEHRRIADCFTLYSGSHWNVIAFKPLIAQKGAIVKTSPEKFLAFELLPSASVPTKAFYCMPLTNYKSCDAFPLTYTENSKIHTHPTLTFDKPVSYITVNIDGAITTHHFLTDSGFSFFASSVPDPSGNRKLTKIIHVSYKEKSFNVPETTEKTEKTEEVKCSCTAWIVSLSIFAIIIVAETCGIVFIKIYRKR